MHGTSRALLLVLFIALLLTPLQTGLAQSGDDLYVPETGHWIRGEFLDFYQQARDPLLLFGYPITDEMTDPINGQTTQYFQRARFDLVTDNGRSQIKLANLGELMYDDRGTPVPIPTTSLACKAFPSTGKNVCYAFLQFYNANNGEKYFGDPIAELEVYDGRYVQYFEDARLEWRPELPSGQRVAPTDLGRMYYDIRFGDSGILQPTMPDADIPQQSLVSLVSHAFVSHSLPQANTQQGIYVIVQSQQLTPIQNAEVRAVMHLPDGQVRDLLLPDTDENGISQLTFNIGELPINEVVSISVEINFQSLQSSTETWFRVWW
jgi:hypothetical protein